MTMAESFQLLGGILLTFAALPQITQVYITRNVKGLNLLTYFMILVGNGFMAIFGFEMALNGNGIVLLITSLMGFTIISILVILILVFRKFPEIGRNRRWK